MGINMLVAKQGMRVSYENGMITFKSRKPMFRGEDAVITYGEGLTKLLNKHKIVHNEVVERDDNGRFKSYHIEVGGD